MSQLSETLVVVEHSAPHPQPRAKVINGKNLLLKLVHYNNTMCSYSVYGEDAILMPSDKSMQALTMKRCVKCI